MDINQIKFTSPTWNVEMSMEDQILHDQNPFSSILHSHPFQTRQTASSSSHHMPISSLLGDQIGNQMDEEEEPDEELGVMKEMMYKIAAMQPVDIDPSTIRKPKRRNIRISDDPQSVAARHRRERISEKIRILQRLVPGGTKMDTASMLDEAIRYVKFLKRQIRLLQSNDHQHHPPIINGDWQVTHTKPLGNSTTSSSLDPPAASLAGLISFDGNGVLDPAGAVCFNHEVISD